MGIDGAASGAAEPARHDTLRRQLGDSNNVDDGPGARAESIDLQSALGSGSVRYRIWEVRFATDADIKQAAVVLGS